MKKKLKRIQKQLNDFRIMYKTLATQYDDLDHKLSDLKYISDTGMKYYSLFAPIKGLEDTCKCNEEPKTEQKLTQKIKGRTTHVKLLEEVSEPNNNDYYQQAKKLLLDYANKVLVKKGYEYTPTGDRFANFRPILNQDKTAMQKLLGYCEKHVQYMYMQSENPSYPNDHYMRNDFIGRQFGYGDDSGQYIFRSNLEIEYNKYISELPKIDDDGGLIEYDDFNTFLDTEISIDRLRLHKHSLGTIIENEDYYRQLYINELLEHFGDVFNYNILGIAMVESDKVKYLVFTNEDRIRQEKEIKSVIASFRIDRRDKMRSYSDLLNNTDYWNLCFLTQEFAKQLERLDK